MVLNQNHRNDEIGYLFLKDNPSKKIDYSIDLLELIIDEFKINARSITRPIASTFEIFKRMICCDNKSEQNKLYNKTVIKIREYLDVNNMIKLMIEFEFLKSIIFSKNVLKLFKTFSDLREVNSEKIVEIQMLLKEIYSKKENNEDSHLDQCAAQFFIENYMKN